MNGILYVILAWFTFHMRHRWYDYNNLIIKLQEIFALQQKNKFVTFFKNGKKKPQNFDVVSAVPEIYVKMRNI